MGLFSKLSLLLIWFSLVGLGILACPRDRPPEQIQAELFLQTYYINIDPKRALEVSWGPARFKLERETALLKGLSSPKAGETPEMTYRLQTCQLTTVRRAQCPYEIRILAGTRKILRRGVLSLRKMDGKWWITQFKEDDT